MKAAVRAEVHARTQACQLCGSTKRVQDHHVNDIVGNAYQDEVARLIVRLCVKCHQALHHATGRRKHALRRQLLLLFGIDIGACWMHRWRLTAAGTTECVFCGKSR